MRQMADLGTVKKMYTEKKDHDPLRMPRNVPGSFAGAEIMRNPVLFAFPKTIGRVFMR